jgi:hypothetical protein
MTDGLTDAAKAEIAAAIAIVREDRFEKFARTSLGKHAPKEEQKDELIKPDAEKDKETVTPPPEKEKEKETPPVRKSSYWGEILE